MSSLASRLVRLIEVQGPLSIAQFMALALMDPTHGYYATRDPFGRAGDFVTAPEISQSFGELLGLWLAECWQVQGLGKARLIELGPGRGTLMKDALRAIAKAAPAVISAIDVVLVEASASLKAVQAQTLAAAPVRLSWAASLPEALDGRPILLLANEFFDALPIRQFVFDGEGWRERMIGLTADGALCFLLAPVRARALVPPAYRGIPRAGDIFEICPAGIALGESLGEAIASQGGAGLIVDYGYGAGPGFADTLQAVKDHAYAGVLDAPGEADLTAHADFAALAASAARGGGTVHGPVPQGQFLDRIGLALRTEQLIRANPARKDALRGEAERLRAPGQMGELFKVLAILPAQGFAPQGFAS